MSLRELLAKARIDWHGVKLFSPDLSEDSDTLAVAAYFENAPGFHFMLNAFWEPLNFAVPPAPENGTHWVRTIDTSLPSPNDFPDTPHEPLQDNYLVQPRSTVLLLTSATQARSPRPHEMPAEERT